MICNGMVSSVDLSGRKARVVFPDKDRTVSAIVPFANHVSPAVNQTATVVFFSANFADGVIIAVYGEG